jgi:hypothetical protein
MKQQEGTSRSGALSALIIYQDVTTGSYAGEFLDRLILRMHIGPTCCSRNFWMVNLLRTPLLQEQVALEASQADLIVLSLNTKQALPGSVREWMGRWLNHKESRPYLLVVVQETVSESSSDDIGDYIQKVADMGRVDFLCWDAANHRSICGRLPNAMDFRNPSVGGGSTQVSEARLSSGRNFEVVR